MKTIVSIFAIAAGISSAVACSSSSSGSSSGTSGGNSSGSAGGEVDCTKLATSACAKFESCFATTVAALYGDVTKCAAAVAESCANEKSLEGSALKTKGAACADEFSTATCEAIFSGAATSCSKGTLAAGTKCVQDGQCASGYCKATAATSSCGTCAEPLAEGATCETECGGSDLECAGGKCAKRGAIGAACGADKPSCAGVARCVASKCVEGKAAGAACSTGADDCQLGLTCAAGTCKAPDLAAVGQACGLVGGKVVGCAGGGNCKLTDTGGVCDAPAGKGEACGTSVDAKRCAPPYTCIDGKCGFTNPASCK